MKKQYLFSALAFSTFLASCSNEIETVAESVKPEAEMEEVVGATLVSKGMSIDVNGPESRQTKEGWEETDLLGMGWYNVAARISDDQTVADWEATMANPNYAEHRIFANHKFINFATESNVYQGAHFVYFPYQRETKVQQKVVKANALDYTVSAVGSMTDAEYDLYNRAFQLSAQDFVSGQDVDDNGELKKQFRLSPMVNGMTVNAIPTLEETATAIKGLKITSVDIYSNQAPFAEEFAIKPNLIPAVVRTEEGEIDGVATDAALDNYIKNADKTYGQHAVRNVASEANYDLSEQRDINVYTFPTNANFKDYAANGNKYTEMITVNVVSTNGLKGMFSIGSSSTHTATNRGTIKTLNDFLGTKAKATLQNVLRKDGVWTTLGLKAELDESNLTMTYDINNKAQWDDAVALAKEIGNDATFTLVDEVEFTESINLPEGIKLTVVSGTNGKMVIAGNVEWPNTDDLNVIAANIVVEEGATLSINGEEGDRNTLDGNATNNGIIALNEFGAVKNGQSSIANNARIEVKYGSYVEATGGIIAFEVDNKTAAYQIDNLINHDLLGKDVKVNTLVVNKKVVLDLTKKDAPVVDKDPYTGSVASPVAMPDLKNINIEMNGGTIQGEQEISKSVNNVDVKSGTTNIIKDVNIAGNLSVAEGAKVTIDATEHYHGLTSYKHEVSVGGNIINEGTVTANVDISTEVMDNEAGKTVVTKPYTIWWTVDYKQGGSAEGNILKKTNLVQISYDSTKTPEQNGSILFDAIMAAEDGDVISVPAGIFKWNNSQLNLTKSVTIIGEEGTVIQRNGERIGKIYVGAGKEVVLKNLEFEGPTTRGELWIDCHSNGIPPVNATGDYSYVKMVNVLCKTLLVDNASGGGMAMDVDLFDCDITTAHLTTKEGHSLNFNYDNSSIINKFDFGGTPASKKDIKINGVEQ